MKSDRLAYPFEYVLIMEKVWSELYFQGFSSIIWKEEAKIWYWYLLLYFINSEGGQSSTQEIFYDTKQNLFASGARLQLHFCSESDQSSDT